MSAAGLLRKIWDAGVTTTVEKDGQLLLTPAPGTELPPWMREGVFEHRRGLVSLVSCPQGKPGGLTGAEVARRYLFPGNYPGSRSKAIFNAALANRFLEFPADAGDTTRKHVWPAWEMHCLCFLMTRVTVRHTPAKAMVRMRMPRDRQLSASGSSELRTVLNGAHFVNCSRQFIGRDSACVWASHDDATLLARALLDIAEEHGERVG